MNVPRTYLRNPKINNYNRLLLQPLDQIATAENAVLFMCGQQRRKGREGEAMGARSKLGRLWRTSGRPAAATGVQRPGRRAGAAAQQAATAARASCRAREEAASARQRAWPAVWHAAAAATMQQRRKGVARNGDACRRRKRKDGERVKR